jgi:molybdate transport system ATP-binding protein
VRELAEEADPALILAPVRVGETDLIARLTRRSADALALAPGRAVWAQVSSVAPVG